MLRLLKDFNWGREMKASDVLRRYEAGEKDFQNVNNGKKINLRGKSFKGKNLSGVNFTNADIRGVDFSNTCLKDAKLNNVEAGLSPVWMVFWILVSLLMLGLSGVVASFSSTFIAFLFFSSSAVSSRIVVAVGLVGMVAVLAVAISKSWSRHLGFIAVAIAFILAAAIAITVAEVATSSVKAGSAIFIVAGAFAVPCFIAYPFARSVPFAVTVTVGNYKTGLVGLSIALLGDIVGVFLATSAIGGNPAFVRNLASLFAVSVMLWSAYIGWKSISEEDKYPLIRRVAFAISTIGATNFSDADLTNCDFSESILKSTNFSRANIKHTRWYKTKRLELAIVGNSILADLSVRKLLVSCNGYKKDYSGKNLKDANLNQANLEGANFEEVDISEATLQDAILKEVNLRKAQSIGTDFRKANFTGACLESWNIDSGTQLGDVECDYIYLLRDKRERLPHNIEGKFAPGDFEKLYKKIMNTVQILLHDGINPEAFRVAINKMIKNNPDIDLNSIQVIEKKEDDVLITIKVPENTNKSKIVREFTEIYNEKINQIMESIKELSEKFSTNPSSIINIQNVKELGKIFMSEGLKKESNFDLKDSQIAGGVVNADNVKAKHIGGNINNYTPQQKQTLADAAKEIQALLEQLGKTYSTDSTTDKMIVAAEAIKQIESNPTLQARILSALKVGSVKAFEQFLGHPAASFIIAALEDWQKNKVI